MQQNYTYIGRRGFKSHPVRALIISKLDKDRNKNVTNDKPQQGSAVNLNTKASGDASGHVWHPQPAINRAWARQAIQLGWVK